MITPAAGVRIWLAAGLTDMRRGFDGLAALVQQHLGQDPFSGHLFVFRGKRGHLLKILFWDGQGLVLCAKRLERGRFVWPPAKDGVVSLTPAQLSMLTGTTKSPLAREALDRIAALYRIETPIRGCPPEQRLRVRTERTAPLMAELKAWLEP